jgi:hypothetical protein
MASADTATELVCTALGKTQTFVCPDICRSIKDL